MIDKTIAGYWKAFLVWIDAAIAELQLISDMSAYILISLVKKSDK